MLRAECFASLASSPRTLSPPCDACESYPGETSPAA